MKSAVIASSLTVSIALAGLSSVKAQNTPTRLTQPIVNAQAQAEAVNQPAVSPEQQARNARFQSRYGSAPPTARNATPPAQVPAVAPAVAPAAVATPAVPGAQPVVAVPAQRPEDDARFRSRYGGSMPAGRAQAAAAAQPPGVARPPVAAPGGAPIAAPIAVAPVRQADPEREQRIINFQRQNAISGNPSAQYDLGMRYMKGDGLEQDNQQALQWLKLAAENDHSRAKKQLEELLKQMENMAPDDKTSAEARVKPAAIPQ